MPSFLSSSYFYQSFYEILSELKWRECFLGLFWKWKILIQITVNILYLKSTPSPPGSRVSVNGINNVRVSRVQPQSYHLWCLSHTFPITSMLSFPFPQVLRLRQSFWTPHFLLFPLFNPLASPSRYNQIRPLLTTTTATTAAQVSIISLVVRCTDSLPGLPTPASSIKQPVTTVLLGSELPMIF